MREEWITLLRDRHIPIDQYRRAADGLGMELAIEYDSLLPKESIDVETPLGRSPGSRLKQEPILVPILRSGLVLLPPFMRLYPNSVIGFIGMRRDEETAIPELYYTKLPRCTSGSFVCLLDPMIATGQSAAYAVELLKKEGAVESQITLVSFIAAPQGLKLLKERCPSVRVIVAQVDMGLDERFRIVPGLGDFGDRYFGL